MILTKLYDALTLITPENGSDATELKEYSICKNEPFSFQMAYKLFDEKITDEQHFTIKIISNKHLSRCVRTRYALIFKDKPEAAYRYVSRYTCA